MNMIPKAPTLNRLRYSLTVLLCTLLTSVTPSWATTRDQCQGGLEAPGEFIWNQNTPRSYLGFHEPVLSALMLKLKGLQILPCSTILDCLKGRSFLSLGEGSSDLVTMLLAQNYNAVAVDAEPSPEFVAQQKKYPGCYFKQKFQKLSLGKRFDFVYSSYALNFVINHFARFGSETLRLELEKLLVQILSHVAEDGVLITVPEAIPAASLRVWQETIAEMNKKGWEIEFYPEVAFDAHPFRFDTRKYGSAKIRATVIKVLRRGR